MQSAHIVGMGRLFFYFLITALGVIGLLFFPIVVEADVHYDMNRRKFGFALYAYKAWKLVGGYVTTYRGGFALHVSPEKAILKPYSGMNEDRKRFSFVRAFRVISFVLTTETGAGQWGTALAMACAYLDLDCIVYQVKCSYEQKPFRREVIRTYGAQVIPSPSDTTSVGRKILQEFPGTGGSLGCAISEAVETAVSREGYRYVLGSVLSQVLLHQSIIGLEAKLAMDKYNIVPDIIIGCAGGGSNLGGLISPFMGEKLRGERDYRFIAVEPASCPSLTRGVFAYDYCDTGKVCPLQKMYTLGSGFMPSANHAGGLRYHGMSAILSQLYHDGYMEARSVEQTEVFQAAQLFARTEGTLPAPESSHAIKAAIDEALRCKETGEEKTILFGLTGTGYFDMKAYESFNNGTMTDYIPTDEEIKKGTDGIPRFEGNKF